MSKMNNTDSNLTAGETSGTTSMICRTTSSWSKHFPNEILGCLTSFLTVLECKSFILTMSTFEEIKSVRNAYLKCNFDCLLGPPASRPYLFHRMEDWLNANDDWKQMYDDPKSHGIHAPEQQDIFDMVFKNIHTAVFLNIPVVIEHLILNRDVDVNTKISRAILLDSVSDINSNNQDDINDMLCPLYILLTNESYPSLSMLEYLLSVKGIDVNQVVNASDGLTILHLCCAFPKISLEKIHLLLSHPGINVNQQDNVGWTPLHTLCALARTSLEKTHLLLSHPNINVNQQANNGLTPLHLTCIRFNEQSVEKAKMLLRAGADVHIHPTDAANMTAYEIALQKFATESNNTDDVLFKFKAEMLELLKSATIDQSTS